MKPQSPIFDEMHELSESVVSDVNVFNRIANRMLLALSALLVIDVVIIIFETYKLFHQ